MAEIVEQVQEREAAQVNITDADRQAHGFVLIMPLCLFFRHEESLTGLPAASPLRSLDSMDVPEPETVPNLGEGPAQKNQRSRDAPARPQPPVHPPHLSPHLTLPKTKASSTARKPPPLNWKLSREAPTGKDIY